MTTTPFNMRTIEYVEQQLLKDWETWEAMQEVKQQQGPLPEDLEHPEKLVAETSESIDEFVRCLGTYMAFDAIRDDRTILPEEGPVLEVLAAASGGMSGLLRRVLAAGLEAEAEALSEQLGQGVKEAKLACEGERRGMVS